MEKGNEKQAKDNLESLKLDLEKQIRELEARKKDVSALETKSLSDLKDELKQNLKKIGVSDNTTKQPSTSEKDFSTIKKNTPPPSIPVKKKKLNSNKKVILPLILIAISLLALVYVYKLRQDLRNEKLLLKEKQKEEIDYNKDAIFKDVEDETPEEDLQDVGQFKDVPEETTKDTASPSN